MKLFVFIRPLYVISCNICNFCNLNPGHIPWVMTPIPSFEGYFAKWGVDCEAAGGGGGSFYSCFVT